MALFDECLWMQFLHSYCKNAKKQNRLKAGKGFFSIMQDLFFKLRISSRNQTKSFSLIFFVCGQVAHPVVKIPWTHLKILVYLIIFRLMLNGKRSGVMFLFLLCCFFFTKKKNVLDCSTNI